MTIQTAVVLYFIGMALMSTLVVNEALERGCSIAKAVFMLLAWPVIFIAVVLAGMFEFLDDLRK